MAKPKRMLLIDYLEGVSWRILEDYPTVIKGIIGRRTGIYALFEHDKLYYVGLASNMLGRVTTHLKDRHKGLWDRFNVYLTPNDEHMKDLESLILRIARPKGNRVKGRLKGAADQYRALARVMAEHDADRRASMIGGRLARRRRQLKTSRASGTSVLAGSLERRTQLKAWLKGNTYIATLRKDGLISFKGELYKSPSTAASAITDRAMNGWDFWHYREGRDWVPLDQMRR